MIFDHEDAANRARAWAKSEIKRLEKLRDAHQDIMEGLDDDIKTVGEELQDELDRIAIDVEWSRQGHLDEDTNSDI
jgi:hypothetical protein